MSGRYQSAGCEPPLEELLTDPIIELLLERDGIDPADLRSYLCSIREKLQPADAEAASGGWHPPEPICSETLPIALEPARVGAVGQS
jgi:hypothetical protein